MDLRVVKEPENHRYVAWLEDDEAGELLFRKRDDVITFTHTGVPPKFEGRGIGSALVKKAMEDARAENLHVVPVCPFVKRWIDRHPEG